MTAMLASSGIAVSAGGSIRTEVSTSPRGRRSGTRLGILVDRLVNVLPEAGRVDGRSTGQGPEENSGWHEHAALHRHELSHRHSIAGDDERLASIKSPHYLPAPISEHSLRYHLRHEPIVARVRRGPLHDRNRASHDYWLV